MKKKLFNMSIIFLCLTFIALILSNNEMISEITIQSVNLWLTKVFPSLFPMFVVSDILIHYGLANILKKIFSPITTKLFKVNGTASYIFIMSLISGTPSSAYITKEMYLNHAITKNEAEKTLCFSFFSNPLFLITMLGAIFPNNPVLIAKLIFIHYFCNIIIGFLIRNFHNEKQAFSMNHEEKPVSFGIILTGAINKSVNTLIMILGTITFYIVITSCLNQILNSTPLSHTLLNGFFEITQGLNGIPLLLISEKAKAMIAVGIISFGGLSIHTQVKSILSDTNISYRPFLFARIIHAIIAVFLVILL